VRHVRLIADDLTGALDSAAQFSGEVGPLPVLLDHETTPPAGSFVLDLACRDGSQAQALARVRATAGRLPGADVAFKKIDSLLRGHWAAELAAIAELNLFTRGRLAPAFPAQGRVTRDGRQHMRDGDGRWTVLPLDPAAALERCGVRVARRRDGDADPPVLLCDAETDEDLEHIVAWGRALPGTTLWCGTAGLARALAGRPAISVAPAPGSHLVMIGSHHPVTLRQIAILEERYPAWLGRFDADGEASAGRINATLAAHGRCVAQAELPPGLAPSEAAIRIDRWLDAVVPHIARPALLTVIGGETFASLCRSLHAKQLAVEGEWRPGVPASRIAGGAWNAMRCFSKSGAFGSPGLLVDLLLEPSTADIFLTSVADP
jgi:uncharacterized protein YgbK (DUF1537 family)